jgi:RNA polymerase sigma factor (sigma-70 family)
MGATMGRVLDVGQADEWTALQGAIAGDAGAFEEIVSARLMGAFRLASAILGDEAEAAEATTNAFVAAWHELPRLRDLGEFDAWLRRILLNECRMQERRRASGAAVEAAPRASSWAADDGWDLDRATAIDRLERAFDELDVEDRSILVLHHLEDTALADVAAALHMPTGTVRLRHHEARDALFRALDAGP